MPNQFPILHDSFAAASTARHRVHQRFAVISASRDVRVVTGVSPDLPNILEQLALHRCSRHRRIRRTIAGHARAHFVLQAAVLAGLEILIALADELGGILLRRVAVGLRMATERPLRCTALERQRWGRL